MKRLQLYSLLLLPLLVSCSSGVVSSSHCDLPEHGWAITDTVYLPITVEDTTQAYDLALMLRHTEQYAYQNLWFFVRACDSLAPVQVDTVMACLADDRGQWLGARTGRYYAGYVVMQHELLFDQPGTYTFAVVHGMRDSVICGVADIGLELRKVKSEN